MGNQDSTGYLVIQLFSFQLLGLCPDYSVTPVTLLCGDVVFSYLGLTVRPDSVPEVFDRSIGHAQYLFKTHALYWQAVTTTITLFNIEKMTIV